MISTIVILDSNCVLVAGVPIGIEDVFIKDYKLINYMKSMNHN